MVEFLKRLARKLLYILVTILYGFPQNEMHFIGVTGTSGKSTTCHMIYHILRKNGYRVGLVSTVGVYAEGINDATGLHVTTPEGWQLVSIFDKFRKLGIKYVILEVSSHALDQDRIGTIKFDIAAITNITSDHLDWHQTWENYARSKMLLAKRVKRGGYLVSINDNSHGYKFIKNNIPSFVQLVSIITKNITIYNKSPLQFKYKNDTFEVPVVGEYNAFNAVAAVEVARRVGVATDGAVRALRDFVSLPGRMEYIRRKPFAIVVDFAHTADALEKSLRAARSLTKGKVIVVFGSAGLRDVIKRTEMGKVSGRLADVTVVTSEDPRTESLYDINTKIINGAARSGARLIKRFPNHRAFVQEYKKYIKRYKDKVVFAFDEETPDSRYDAIKFAIALARDGDMVITEGKGHEQSLCFGTTEYEYNDHDAVMRALQKTQNDISQSS